jgi:hypothetical protein
MISAHLSDQGDHCLSDGNPQHLGSRDIDDKLEFCVGCSTGRSAGLEPLS